jgi:deoxyribonuclease-4
MSFIENTNIQIGGHLGFSKQVLPTVVEAIEHDMSSIQFFLGNPKSFTRQRLTKEDVDKTRKLVDKHNINVFSHFPYVCSLVGSVASLAWDGNAEQDVKTTKIVKELEYEINTLAKLSKKSGVVIHPGSHKNTNGGLEAIAKSINLIDFEENANLLLENSAGQGSTLYRNFKEASKILQGIDSTKKEHVFLCLDSAHLTGVGDYDLSKRDDIDKLFHNADRHVGLDKIKLIHLNDSKVELGAKKDLHECLCFGRIWENNPESLKYLLTRCGELKIPIVLETPNILQDMHTVNNL